MSEIDAVYVKTSMKSFNATLLNYSEYHLHYCDFIHSLNVISFLEDTQQNQFLKNYAPRC
jgi:hypothetical protein